MMKRRTALLCLILLLGTSSFPGTTTPWREEPALQRTILTSRYTPPHPVRAIRSSIEEVIQWACTYGDADTDETARSIIQTMDGGYAFAGTKGGATWLVKTDARGVVQWNRTYGGTLEDYAYSVIETTDGGFALAGTTDSYGAEGGDALVVKTDAWGIAPEPEITSLKWVVLGVGGSLAFLVTVVIVLWRRKKRR